MSSDIAGYHQELLQQIGRDADAEGRFSEESFFNVMTSYLVDEGELETADLSPYQHAARGLRVDGYGGDPTQADGVLSIIVSDFSPKLELGRLTATEMEAVFKRATSFVAKSLDPAFRAGLEETSAGFGLADLIAMTWAKVAKVKVVLISNRLLSQRVDGRSAGVLDSRPVVYSVWDIGRLFRFTSTGRAREDAVVDLDDFGGPLAALPANLTGADYESYLVVVPADQLAAIYDRWGARLLEQNVRVFLQARGGVNKGIRATLENDPDMFFAYNNGITATAERIETSIEKGKCVITKIQNLQIVNGGQTTASIYAASQKKPTSLQRVFVQMKLSVISPDRAEEVVPKISQYANSQNKVNAADFFSNHPYHLRMKEFSTTLFAPSPDGSFRETKWFYERARGQYDEARNGLSLSERRKFELEYPRQQVFSKTDLSKYLASWAELPHFVSRGAQKNFALFAGSVGKEWDDEPNQFNESYYRQLVAKTIIFRDTERLVSRQSWYEGGYRANIVSYALAKLAHDARTRGYSVRLENVWRSQAISNAMRTALEVAAEAVTGVLLNPDAGRKNVSEWAKQPACWARVAAVAVAWPADWMAELSLLKDQQGEAKAAMREQKVLNGIEAQSAVVRAEGAIWLKIRRWAVERRLLSQKELDILAIAADMPRKLPTEKQCVVALAALKKLHAEGCPHGADIV